MVSKVAIIVALCVVVAAAAGAEQVRQVRKAYSVPLLADDPHALDREVTFYDCSQKDDGNYVHPTDCTRFISCVARKHAYERDCAPCNDPVECPEGRTHYHYPDDACLYLSEAGCVVDPGDPGEDPTTQGPPDDDDSCDPDDCWVKGYCQDYSYCEREESDHKGKGKRGSWKNDTCDPALNMYFNPHHNSVHGGVCDFWENLDKAIKDHYNSDPACINPHCEWKPDPTSECSSTYWYFHPEQNDGQDQELHCPQRPDGEQLVWDQSRKSCHTCSNVPSSTGFCC